MLPPGSTAGAGAEETRGRERREERKEERRRRRRRGWVSRAVAGKSSVGFPGGGVTRARTRAGPNLYSRETPAATAAVCTLYPSPPEAT